MSRCTGHCCEGFYLSPDVTERLLEEPERLTNGMQMREMLLPTGKEDHWNCLNFDSESRECKVYEDRPKMCVDFPNGEACPRPGCTLSGEDLKHYEEKWKT